jgi:DNA segregation ATPase FtsK/SpoIIIE-like protein
MTEEYYLFKRVDAHASEKKTVNAECCTSSSGRPKVQFSLEHEEHERMKLAAKKKGLSMADYARQAALERLGRDPDARKPVRVPDATVVRSGRGRDPLYDEAIYQVVQQGRGSVSLLQRCLGVGYGRASRLIDQMHEDGILGEYRSGTYRTVVGEPIPNGQPGAGEGGSGE